MNPCSGISFKVKQILTISLLDKKIYQILSLTDF